MTEEKIKLLFCLLNNKVGGGNRVLLEIANRSQKLGHKVHLSFADDASTPTWFDNECRVLEDPKQSANLNIYDFVFVSNASAIPDMLRRCEARKLVFICQGYEPYCYGDSVTELFSPKPSLENIYKIGIPIIATSRSIQTLIKDNLNCPSHLVPVGIDAELFPRLVSRKPDMPKRILVVGDYKMKFKGIQDVSEALEILSKDIFVQLVVLTQQKLARDLFANYSFPVEFHLTPPQSELPNIYASCHAYCCGSWYEGFGLPCLEAFSVGIPVVSTNNLGVLEFARDNENILLASINSPSDLAAKLRLVLTDETLRSKLTSNGSNVVKKYSWTQTMNRFFDVLAELKAFDGDVSDLSGVNTDQLLEELEQAGLYTPPNVERDLRRISGKLQELLAKIKEDALGKQDCIEAVAEIRQSLQEHLHSPSTSYYKEFKARFDICQLFKLFDDPKAWQEAVSRSP